MTPILGEKLGLAVGEGHDESTPGGLKSTFISFAAYIILFLPAQSQAGRWAASSSVR